MIAVGLMCWGGFNHSWAWGQTGSPVVVKTDQEIHGTVIDQPHFVSVEIANHGNQSVTIVGVQNVCGKNACVSIKNFQQLVLAPNETIQLKYGLRPFGPFGVTSNLVVEDGQGKLYTIPIFFHGQPTGDPLPFREDELD